MFSFIRSNKFYVVLPFILVFAVLAFSVIFSWIVFRGADHFLVIHFLDGKADFFGTVTHVFSIVGIGSLIAFLNALFTFFLYHRDRKLAFVLAYSTLFIVLLIFITIAVIISVN
ncbi:MAG: hypothetical protein COU07_01345 [Candidatus Harrisonbacteria bacterium CG10_big_fil_rev_8_21_14_0_10_40_38]|uniref:DUF420 domain-containing protein n=1 Tax=Candidatus Harrisonbacteria bacterium CG10_big_fil_rev_8_21_14_0_10_40_38 TaxID=1974583 RepID=A0A2H0USZ2_9BACT|nr:MAG: hypothetical protein COU07_01345 [Candidatus Harrisonbacteria bacterium CG10_big_fil_rev_8_21_14_0_10_40_38]